LGLYAVSLIFTAHIHFLIMKKPFNSLLNFCAFGLLLWAVYLNFVDLNKQEAPPPVKQLTEQQTSNTVEVADMQQQPDGLQ